VKRGFDLIVITAANKAQARGYRAQLKGRVGYVVVPDPGDRRVGSLGATVNVLRKLKTSGRVLIVHSGGDAKRTPAYAAMGKAFVPMKDGRPMLDHIVDEMAKLKLPGASGVVVCCGDVIPYLDYSKVDLAKSGVTGVAYPDGPWQAQRHGVYAVAKENGPGKKEQGKGEREKVVDFLQKPKVTKGTFLIDTGIMYFDWKTAAKMTKLPIAGDIYEEFPKMLLAGFAPFQVAVTPKCEFFHIGSSRELLEKLSSTLCPLPSTLYPLPSTLIDSCAAPLGTLAGENIVTNVPAEYGRVDLKKGECLTALPLGKSEWYFLKYHIDDTFKTDGLWDKHGLSEKMKIVNHERLLKVRKASLKANRTITVTAPVRIDLSGGWSDTPPICQKEGGLVLAAAVRLDGKRPIKVTVAPRADKLVKIVSKDLDRKTVLESQAEIDDHHDPHDWCCLVKSALTVTGFKFGERGLDITISADLPKGSGMGTSSILGAATIAALLGEVDTARVGELTLRLEQEMCTGGGWEDQFAGMTPGVKLLRSRKGERQQIAVEPVQIPVKTLKALKERSALYFTGQKRMARNVLRRVLGFYEENPHGFAKVLIGSVKADAAKAAAALQQGDLETFAGCVNRYWRDKKLLDAGSTNEKVDDIIDLIRPHVAAVTLAGAGGGGFMYILAKSPRELKKVRMVLEKNPPSPASRFYTFDIDNDGMQING